MATIAVGAGRAEFSTPVSVLLHGDGTNGSTTIIDETGKTVTAMGNTQISTVQSKFGGASILLDGTGDCATIPDSSDIELGSGDFTLECWVNPSSVTGTFGLLGKQDGTFAFQGYVFYITTGGVINVSAVTADNNTNWTTTISSSAGAVATGSWQHVAAVRRSGTLYIYVGGVQVATGAFSLTITNNTSGLAIGALKTDGSFSFNGYVDELRIKQGEALYVADFIPQLQAFRYTAPILSVESNTSIAVAAGALAITGNASEISRFVVTPAGNGVFTGDVPIVEINTPGSETPGGGQIISTGHGPTVNVAYAIEISAASIAIAGQSPTPSIQYTINIAAGTIALTGQSVIAAIPVIASPAGGSSTLTGQSLTSVVGVVGLSDTGSITISGSAPGVQIDPAVSSGAMIVAGQTVVASVGYYIPISVGAMTITGSVPWMATTYALPAGSLTVTGQAVILAQGVKVAVGSAGLTFTGSEPTIPDVAEGVYTVVTVRGRFTTKKSVTLKF